MAKKLGIAPEQALLLLEEVLYDEESRPIEYSCNYFIPAYFRFRVLRR